MPNGGQLTLSGENIVLNDNFPAGEGTAPGPYVMITVSDTGSGIPPELRSRIFEPFFTTKPADKGTGLGLSTVMNIIKRHDGFVELDSEVGKGTTFKIHIPAVTAATAQESELKGAALPSGNGEVVLLVDDEVSVLELGKSTLTNYGYRLLTAGNGLEAIACFELHKHEIRLVIMDADMPYLDGISALRRIRKIDPNVPVIIASASSYDTGYVSKLSHIITLPKPYGVEDLVRGAAQALGNMQTADKASGATPVLAHA
jgi:CheY-like chemotaxis protein